MRLVTVATCNIGQWAMDFSGNLARVKESIIEAKRQGAIYRVGPELELPGYGCEDHFLEEDTMTHSWECMAEILKDDLTDGIVCDLGFPCEESGVRYNCRALVLNRKILLIRPKMWLANDGNYRETRWFASWKRKGEVVDLPLPKVITELIGQEKVPFGDGVLAFSDTVLGSETCEELFTPAASHIDLSLSGIEILSNGSGSHHQLRKLNTRMELMKSAMAKVGGVYLYSNQQGCDGGRLYYDGCACIIVNGEVVAQGSQFSLKDVEVVSACVDLDAVTSYRGAVSSMREQASEMKKRKPAISVPFRLSTSMDTLDKFPSLPIAVRYYSPEQEIALGPACWLWDYLRRSGASGYLLPLSGGADSSSVAAIVGSMCQLVVKAIQDGNQQVKADAIRIGQYKEKDGGGAGGVVVAAGGGGGGGGGGGEGFPRDPVEFANRIFHTVYMGSENSSDATRKRADKLAKQIGASHLNVRIDSLVLAFVSLFLSVTGKRPLFRVDGGSDAENKALQNIQARVRMVLAFLLAQLLPWVRGRGGGFLLVLGSSNVDEGLRGYLTKYDCSSADVNPIGGISKHDLRAFLRWASIHLGYAVLQDVESAPPTAELEPIRSNYVQTDEVDMGMTYEELTLYGRLRKVLRCGPVSMFEHLCHRWHDRYSPVEVATKVKTFFRHYAINRHKMTTLTPSYHAENYSPEDNRFDLRQFLYNTRWPWQFRKIDDMVVKSEKRRHEADGK